MSAFRFFSIAILALAMPAQAQFREIKAAPFPPAVARQRIRAQLASANAENKDAVVNTISAWLDWYRDILDEELIARWKSDARANLPLVMAPLADARVAREVVDYSWRVNRAEAFTLDAAAMLGDLMARYSDSARGFVEDLLPPAAALPLPQPAAQAVCRILIDMPDIGNWHRNAAQILPRYRTVADAVTKADAASADQERSYRALRWRTELRLDPQPVSSAKRVTLTPRAAIAEGDPVRPHITGPMAMAPPGAMPAGYSGPREGVFEWKGDPVPAFGQCIFADVPQTKILLDFDTKKWDAAVENGDGGRQVLVMRNKTKNAQKKCVVRWSVQE